MMTPGSDDAIDAGGPDDAFQRYLAQGRFLIQRGVRTGNWVYYPRSVAPVTGEDLIWAEPSGLGTVYSTTCVRARPPALSRNIALIDLDEGPRMMSRVEGIDADAVTIGMRVKASIQPYADEEGTHIVVFHPVEGAQ